MKTSLRMRNRVWLAAAVAALLAVLALPSALTTQAQTFGTNWSATFYPSTDLTGSPVGPVNYPTGLNLNWPGVPTDPNGQPIAGFSQSDNFSVEFTSTQNFASSGTYTFSGFVDDRITVFIDGVQAYGQTTPGNFSFNFSLAAGNHSFRIEFIELTSSAILQFQWQLTGGGGGVQPTAVLTPTPFLTPTPTGPTGPVGQVVNVEGLSLRTGPYLGGSFIAVLRPEIEYTVLAKNNDEGGPFTWYRVQTSEQVGWASGRYLLVTNGEPPEVVSGFEQEIANPESTGVYVAPRAFMNFRRRPSVRSAKIDDLQIPWGEEVELLGRTIQFGRNHWFQVRYEGRVGWAYAPYFGVTQGSLAAVPIY